MRNLFLFFTLCLYGVATGCLLGLVSEHYHFTASSWVVAVLTMCVINYKIGCWVGRMSKI